MTAQSTSARVPGSPGMQPGDTIGPVTAIARTAERASRGAIWRFVCERGHLFHAMAHTVRENWRKSGYACPRCFALFSGGERL